VLRRGWASRRDVRRFIHLGREQRKQHRVQDPGERWNGNQDLLGRESSLWCRVRRYQSLGRKQQHRVDLKDKPDRQYSSSTVDRQQQVFGLKYRGLSLRSKKRTRSQESRGRGSGGDAPRYLNFLAKGQPQRRN